jgi:hypothetical protein
MYTDPMIQKGEWEQQARRRAAHLAEYGPTPEMSTPAKVAANIFSGIFGVLMYLFFMSFGVFGIFILAGLFGA